MTVYFTASYSTRRFVAGLGFLLLGVGIAVAAITVSSPQDFSLILNYCFAVVFIAAGAWLLKTATKVGMTTLSVTIEGVSYGPQSFSWNEIAQLGIMPGRKSFYCTPRSASGALEFAISRKPCAKRISDLFQTLAREIVPLHPHLQLCNDDPESRGERIV